MTSEMYLMTIFTRTVAIFHVTSGLLNGCFYEFQGRLYDPFI